jgi:hypothetical protein
VGREIIFDLPAPDRLDGGTVSGMRIDLCAGVEVEDGVAAERDADRHDEACRPHPAAAGIDRRPQIQRDAEAAGMRDEGIFEPGRHCRGAAAVILRPIDRRVEFDRRKRFARAAEPAVQERAAARGRGGPGFHVAEPGRLDESVVDDMRAAGRPAGARGKCQRSDRHPPECSSPPVVRHDAPPAAPSA